MAFDPALVRRPIDGVHWGAHRQEGEEGEQEERPAPPPDQGYQPPPGPEEATPPSQAPARADIIAVSSPAEDVARLQLAARWAERYSRPHEDFHDLLERFRVAYDYLDAVMHGVEPPTE